MAVNNKKISRKYSHEPEDTNHKFYETNKIIAQCKIEGKTGPEIQETLINYLESERIKCVNSIEYFAENYGFITGPGGAGIIPMRLEGYQKTLLKSFVDEKYVIAAKARQLGVSTALMFYALWFSIFSQGKRCLIVAHRKESAEEFITKLKTAYEFLPQWLKPGCTLYSKSEVEFDTKSRIKAITSNPNAARSFSATLVLLDEAAFVKDCDGVVKAIGPTIAASDGKLIAISTPNGNSPDNWFYTTVSKARARKQTQDPLEVNWKLHELPWTVSSIFTRNPNFRRDQIRLDNDNEDKFKQEYEICFNINLFSLFTKESLAAVDIHAEIINKTYGGATYEDTFYMWKKAKPTRRYIIGVDCASNKITARDYTCFQVIDQDTYEQCAEYIGKLPTEVFIDILIKAGRHYNNAMLVIESNSYSEMVFYLLEQKRYANIWYDPIKNTPGFQTNRATRSLLIEKLLLFYNNPFNASQLKSSRLRLQMENFTAGTVYSDGTRKPEAKTGNDDACFPKNTLITTKYGVKPIQDIKIGDLVLTHKGNYKPVQRIGNRETSKLLKIKAVGKPEILCTEEHPFYSHAISLSPYFTINKLKNPWVRAENLDTNYGVCSTFNNIIEDTSIIDLLQYSATSYVDNNGILESWLVRKANGKTINPKGSKIKRYIEVDLDFCWLMGYFLAEGSTGKHSIGFASHIREIEFRKKCISWFAKMGISKYYEKQSSDSGSVLSFNNGSLCKFFKEFSKSNTKKLPDFVMTLPIEKQKAILFGYLCGDGSFASGNIACATISSTAAYQLYELFLRCGYLLTLETPRKNINTSKILNREIKSNYDIITLRGAIPVANQIKTDINTMFDNLLNCKIVKNLTIKQNQTNIRFYENYVVGRIQQNEIINKTTMVYNLEVLDDNSYIANGYVVHNCLALALAVVTMTPKEREHRPHIDANVAYDASSTLSNGEYTEEYLIYHSAKMGISKEMLESRLALYHKIKSGEYAGTGLDELDLQHPVEEYERRIAADELIGNTGNLILDDSYSLAETISLIPTHRKFTVDDIFSDEFRTITEMHGRFLWNRNR